MFQLSGVHCRLHTELKSEHQDLMGRPQHHHEFLCDSVLFWPLYPQDFHSLPLPACSHGAKYHDLSHPIPTCLLGLSKKSWTLCCSPMPTSTCRLRDRDNSRWGRCSTIRAGGWPSRPCGPQDLASPATRFPLARRRCQCGSCRRPNPCHRQASGRGCPLCLATLRSHRRLLHSSGSPPRTCAELCARSLMSMPGRRTHLQCVGLGPWLSGASCLYAGLGGKAKEKGEVEALPQVLPQVHGPEAVIGARCRGPLHLAPITASDPEALPPGLPPAVFGQPAVPAAPSTGLPAAHVQGPWRPLDREARRTSLPLSAPSLWHAEVLTCAARHASSKKSCQPKGFFRHVRSAFKQHGTLCG